MTRPRAGLAVMALANVIGLVGMMVVAGAADILFFAIAATPLCAAAFAAWRRRAASTGTSQR